MFLTFWTQDTKQLRPGHRDSKGCHMISARMSAKQLYFPRISRAQRRPFSDRNPLFLEGVYFQAVETIGQIRFSQKHSCSQSGCESRRVDFCIFVNKSKMAICESVL